MILLVMKDGELKEFGNGVSRFIYHPGRMTIRRKLLRVVPRIALDETDGELIRKLYV